jgi:hypothetical protein
MTQKVVIYNEEVNGSKTILLLFSVLFGKYVTNLRGTFVENVKKVQNQPTLMCTTLTAYTGRTSQP